MGVAEIHQDLNARGGWLLVIEGCAIGFTNINALAGSGASSWIGTTYGAREVLLGLDVPDLSLGETQPLGARITEQRPTFRIKDFNGEVAALFAELWPDATTDSMGARLAPTDDPAPEFTVGPNLTPIGLWGRHVGTEAIGPAGERRHFWVEPTNSPPGLDHQAGSETRPPSLVTDDPRVWTGRTVAVYRIVYDSATGTWPSWALQHSGGSLWWVGKVKGRGSFQSTDNGRVFSLPCSSVASLLRKSLNTGRPPTWTYPAAGVALSGDETKVAAWIGRNAGVQVNEGGIIGTPTIYDVQTLASGNTLAGLTTRADIVAKIRDIVETMISGADTSSVLASTNAQWTGTPGSDSYWQFDATDGPARDVRIDPTGASIEIKCEVDSDTADGYFVALAMDARVWQLLGWDINASGFSKPELCPVGGEYWGENKEDREMPDYHYVGRFSTIPAYQDDDVPPTWLWTNNGSFRTHLAPYPEGTVTLDPAGDQEIRLPPGVFYTEGQFGQPYVYGNQIDSIDVDTTGWWIFRGQRLTAAAYLAGEDDPEDYVQVALCEWVTTSSGDGVEVDSLGYAVIRVIRWEDPRRFGIPYAPMDEPWVMAAGQLECAPLGVLGGIALGSYATPAAPDWRHRLIPRVLLSSGTATWDESSGEVEISPGVNHPADAPALDPWAGDVEAADLGLGIPRAWVDWASWYTCASKLPGGASGALNRVTYGLAGSVQAEDLLAQMMGGVGWAWSWKRADGAGPPQLGCWDPIAPLSVEDVEVVLSRATSAAETQSPATATGPQWRAVVELREDGPFDRFAFAVDAGPLDTDYAYEITFPSQDFGARYRDGKLSWEIEDAGLRNATPWLGTPEAVFYMWSQAARERFALGFGNKYARSGRLYRQILDATYITRIGLGTIVWVIDSTAESPDGTIGVNHLGRVIEARILNRSGLAGIQVAVLLEPKAVDDVKVWAPSAQGGVGSWDEDASTLTISQDWAGVGGGHNDVRGFTQPEWDGHDPGALRVLVYQSEDGVTYPAASEVRADVVSVDSATNAIVLTNLDGAIYRDTIKWIVGAPYDEQTAPWALALYMPVTLATGLYDATKGFRL